MAQIVNNVFPFDDPKSKGLGFSFPLSGNAVFNSTFTTRDVIKTNLINWLLTNKGERIMKPEFGANLRELIFEGLDDITTGALEDRIRENIAIEFPNVEIVSITFNNDPDRNVINFILTYNIKNTEETDELNIELQ